jgi:hypothetical protein
MHRRDFIAASALATSAAAVSALPANGQNAGPSRHYCEWRTYRLEDEAKQGIVSKYLETAAVPAWNRLGLEPVGVFREIGPDAGHSLHVLLVFPTFDKFASERTSLEADAEYQKNAVDYLAAQQDDPAFERIDSWLLVAFDGMPQPKAPAKKLGVYELRTYESHSEERARKKIEMFNKYEITIFPDCGFTNVFFGESLIGSGLPNLKYMLAAPDMPTNEAGWKRFIEHPDWLKVRDLPEYKNTVSKIHKLFLEPLPFSQI